MRKKILQFRTLWALLLVGLAASTFAQAQMNGNVYTMEKDYANPQRFDIKVDSPVTFYDEGGPDKGMTALGPFLVHFVPANKGDKLTISFDELALSPNDGKLLIYNGKVKLEEEYDQWNEDYDYVIPSETPSLTLTSSSQAASSSFTSTDESGAITVVYVSQYDKAGNNWKATLSTGVPSNMTYVATETTFSSLPTTLGARQFPLATLKIITKDRLNPLTLDAVKLDIQDNDNILSNLKLMDEKGDVFTFDPASGVIGGGALSSGSNYFKLLADIDPDKYLKNATIKVQSVTISGTQYTLNELHTFAATDEVRLSTTPYTYLVSRRLRLYDDGGATDKISEKFDGYATFLSADTGKKVSVTFNKLNLFTYSGRADKLEVYDGRKRQADKLLATYLDKPGTTYATGEEGSLTVSLKSVTGASFGDGFEAVVDLFTPQKMEIESASVKGNAQVAVLTPGKAPVAAGVLSVSARHTLSPLSLTKVSFNISEEGAALLDKVYVYNASGSLKLGSAEVKGGIFTVTLDKPFELADGEKSFTIKADANLRAGGGNRVAFKLESITTSDAKETKASSQSAVIECMTETKAVATLGKQTIYIYNDWEFVDEKNEFGKHVTVGGQRIVTFINPDDTKKVELDFSNFNVPFSYMGGVNATFTIYDGESNSGKILWELTKSNQKTGPSEPVRSSGKALTVYINYNGFGNTGSFSAIARSYEPKSMKVLSSGQGATEVVTAGIGDADQPVATFHVTTEGALTPLTISKVEFGLQHFEAIKSLALFLEDNLAAKGTAVPNGETVLMTLSEPVTLTEGTNNFKLCATIAETAQQGTKVGFSVNKIIFSDGSEYTITAPSNPILVELQNIFKHPADGKNVEKRVIGELTYLDYAGKEKLPKEAMHSSVTFIPQNDGEVVSVQINTLEIQRNDKLVVYRGKEIKPENKLFELKGATLSSPINHPSFWGDVNVGGGALTFDYNKTSYTYGDYEGWDMTVKSIKPRERFATFVKAEPIAPTAAMQGASKLGMLKLTVKVEGETGAALIPQIKVVNNGFQRIAVLNGGSKANFDMNMPEVAFATKTGEVLLTATEQWSENGTYYLYLVGDVAADAVAGSAVGITLKEVNGVSASEEAAASVAEGMKGTYTVGSADADFADLNSLSNALSKGISGAVTILFKAGTYSDTIRVQNIPGVSETNTLTFGSESGKAKDVIFDGENKPKVGTSPRAYFTVSGTPYVTIENITFRSEKLIRVYEYQLSAEEGSHYFTVKGCRFELPKQPSNSGYNTTPRSLVIYSSIESPIERNNSHTLIENNTFIGGEFALNHCGSGGVSNMPTENVVIRNNTFIDQSKIAVYVNTFIRNLLIEGNKIITDNEFSGKKGFKGIHLVTGNLNERITANSIILSGAEDPQAIVLKSLSKRYNDPILVDNNLIVVRGTSNSRNMKGISIDRTSDVKIVHNTIRMEGSYTNAKHLFWPLELKMGNGYLVQNNLIQNMAGDFVVAVLSTDIPKFSHNAYYTNGTLFGRYNKQGETKAVEAKDFAEWTAYTGEEGSINQKATFLSDETGALLGGGAFNCGLPYEGITTDITGAKRNSEHPTVGAFEFEDDTMLPLEISNATAVTQSTSAQVKLIVSRNAKLHYSLKPSDLEAPTAEELLAIEPKMVAKQEEITLPFDNLLEAKSYTLYAVLEAVSEIKKTDLLKVLTFTTEIKPTAPATFDHVADYEEGKPFADGTMRFTGFKITKEENNGIAEMNGTSATIQLTNSLDDLELDAFKLRAQGKVTLETNKGKKLVVPGNFNADWRTIDLKGISPLNTLTITVAEGVAVAIDDFGAAPGELKLEISEPTTTKEGEVATITFMAPEAVYPLTYVMEPANKVGKIPEAKEVWFTRLGELLSPATTTEYRLTLTDKRGRTETAYSFVMVNPQDGKSYAIADFENPIFLDEGIGKARNTRPMMSGSFSFPLEYNSKYQSFTGIAFSQATDTEFNGDWKTGQYFVPAGKGAANSKSFAIGFMPSDRTKGTLATLSNDLIAQPIQGAYFSMTSWQKAFTETAKNAPDQPKGFKDGDFIEVTLTADNGASVVLVLADWRNGKKELMDKWTYTDLTSLGNVRSLYATFKSSRASTFEGVTYDDAPAYLAFDNLGGKPEGNEEVFTPAVDRQILVAGRELVVKGAEGVNVLVYDLSGRLVYSVVATSDDFRRTLPLENGNYVVVCADKQVKVTLR